MWIMLDTSETKQDLMVDECQGEMVELWLSWL